MNLRLVPDSGAPIELEGPIVRVGRDATCDLVLKDSSVSRVHAVIERTANGWSVTDQRSANGVYIDDRHINSAALQHGQKLRIGIVAFKVELDGGPEGATLMLSAQELMRGQAADAGGAAPVGFTPSAAWWAVAGVSAVILVVCAALAGFLVFRDRLAARDGAVKPAGVPSPAMTQPAPPTAMAAPPAKAAAPVAAAAAPVTEPPKASSPATPARAALLLASDQECQLRIDGKSVGNLSPDMVRTIAVPLGEHLVTALSADGSQRWEQVVAVRNAEQVVVKVQLPAVGPARAAEAAPPVKAPPPKATAAEASRPVAPPILAPAPPVTPKTPEPRRAETDPATFRPLPPARELEPARTSPVTMPPVTAPAVTRPPVTAPPATAPVVTAPPVPKQESEEIATAMRQMDDRAYETALGNFDAVARRLAPDSTRSAEAAQAKLFAGVALVGMGQQEAARSRFRDALALGGANLRLDPGRFNRLSRPVAEQAAKVLETVRP